jgi:hypothetical protein
MLGVDGALQFNCAFLVTKMVQLPLKCALFLGNLVIAHPAMNLLIVEAAKFMMLTAIGVIREKGHAFVMEPNLVALLPTNVVSSFTFDKEVF